MAQQQLKKNPLGVSKSSEIQNRAKDLKKIAHQPTAHKLIIFVLSSFFY